MDRPYETRKRGLRVKREKTNKKKKNRYRNRNNNNNNNPKPQTLVCDSFRFHGLSTPPILLSFFDPPLICCFFLLSFFSSLLSSSFSGYFRSCYSAFLYLRETERESATKQSKESDVRKRNLKIINKKPLLLFFIFYYKHRKF